MGKKTWGIRASIASAVLAASSCGVGLAWSTSAQAASSAAPKVKIAFLMPETTSSPRWEYDDRPDFIAEMKKLDPNAQIIYNNAQGSESTQLQQVESAITNGAQLLVVAPVNGYAASTIVTEASRAKVPVISYDRLIMNAKVQYYVSFNNVEVGRLQGEYIAQHTKKGGTVVMLDGAPTDPNAKQFAEGAHQVLDPLFKSGKLKLGYEQYTQNWDSATAQTEMEQALTKLNNKVNGVLAANDNLAGAAIQALTQQHIKGIPVTGQDATDAGLHRIYYDGTQSMTVYKPIKEEAKAAADLAYDILTGKKATGLVNGSTANGAAKIPSVLLTPIMVTKANVASTVIKDGYTTWAHIKNPAQQ
ncbi:xylose binding protein transport system [Alicyclobacillus hesperidum URH17-3-68]|uniref:D-xylose ABC transporter substrate-binding protein n=1 Tax=Alicyclobacillus hesperidum TaxID=89784 RepID=A0A1H2W2D3_9BACL|nr:sugar ABC transporter substrate-binding protein [Alicyclobacillus hesperidum]EJY54810.1 xylose binding protein transport system [Alicyclobacillus hesperidum URH17-3-68]GLV14836.1 D-xylose ABC transporter substrate-binding protein [Alicyclobacillus hesperidum]SDW74677.1 monosaccharide ABC transporter substrate-binding protein, CUT2 family [Alicyclobacillus hesperidum]